MLDSSALAPFLTSTEGDTLIPRGRRVAVHTGPIRAAEPEANCHQFLTICIHCVSMLPTIRTVLESPPAQRGNPVVVSGETQLDRAVRWVHISDLSDLEGLLEGGELILSTGADLRRSDQRAIAYLKHLLSLDVSGLAVERGTGFNGPSDAATAYADAVSLPLIVFRSQVRFRDITEFVHRRIVAEHYEDLEFAQRVHGEMTALSLGGASAQEIVSRAAELSRRTIVLERISRHVVVYANYGSYSPDLLNAWVERSRRAPILEGSGVTGDEGWLTTPVGAHGQEWGRLVMPSPPSSHQRMVMLLERAAQALELGRMVEREQVGLQYQAQRSLLIQLQSRGSLLTEDEALSRAAALGLELGAHYLPIVVHIQASQGDDPVSAHQRGRRLLECVAAAVQRAGLSALMALIQDHQVGLVVSCRKSHPPGLLERFSAAVDQQCSVPQLHESPVIGAGRISMSLIGASSALPEVQHIAAAAALMPHPPRPYYTNANVRIKGLLVSLANDPRLQAFVETELGPLLLHDAEQGDELTEILSGYLNCGGNITRLSKETHWSRPALYSKIKKIETILAVSLDEPLSRLSLGVALTATELSQDPS